MLADINLFEWIEYFFFLYNSLAATSKQIDIFLQFLKPEILIDLINFEDNSESCIIRKSKPIKINQKSITNYFNKDLFETYYTFSNINDLRCSYQLIITLIKYYYQVFFNNSNYNELNINKIKEDLLEIYTSDQYGISFLINRFKYDKIPVRPYISILKFPFAASEVLGF